MPDNNSNYNETITALSDLQKLAGGAENAIPSAMLDLVAAQTIGMAMHNAVNAQQHAQTLYAAATASTCAYILSATSHAPTQHQAENGSAPAENNDAPTKGNKKQ